MALFPTLFGRKRNPEQEANRYLEQIPGIGRESFNPFIQQGQQAQEALSPIYGQMAQNPMDYLNQILGGYQPSAGYQYKQKQLMDTARNAAAAGGYAGTPYDQREQTELVNSLLGQDMQQFLQNVLGIQGAGIGGYEGAVGRGYESSGMLADLLSGKLGSQAGLAYQGAQQNNANRSQRTNAALNMIAQGLSAAATGGMAGMAGMAGAGGMSALSGLSQGNFGASQWR